MKSGMENLSLNLILFILLLKMVLQQDYYFQMYPSEDEDKPYLFHAYTQPSGFITINTTEGEECKIIEKKTVTETVTRNLSSVIMYKNNLLIKTCFNPGKLVEIINKNKNVFSRTKDNLNNIKYCYSTAIIDPNNENKNAIFTYWTEFQIINGKEKYIHKCILFYIEQNTFSNEITLTPYSNFINYLINDNYYPQNCINFRNRDIYCDIYFGSSESTLYENSFVIETENLLTSGKINLVYSKDFDKESFHKPFSIGTTIRDTIEGGEFDAFLTQYHDKINSGTFLLSSLYRRSIHSTYIFKFNFFKRYYGINIENQYIEPNLFNILIPNQNDLMAIYIMKKNNKNLLIMSRFNLTFTSESHRFEEMSISNYLREGDICSEPKYMQSIFVNSFINYNSKDKETINKNGVDNYYKYQKDIVSLISCKNNQNDITYDAKKIIIPQCLNNLDEINGKDKHILRFETDKNDITIDIYNDPNYVSLRDVGIEFIYETLFLINYKLKGATNYRPLNKKDYNTTINGITHIKFIKTPKMKSSIPLYVYYRLKKTDSSGNSIQCHLSSDRCELEFHVNLDCYVQYCKYCLGNECQECEDIEGLILDKTLNKCMCDEEKGFKPEPDTINKMCVCKTGYSFYKNTKTCKENTILKKYFCLNRTDDVSLLPIYDDCPPSTNCTQDGTCPENKTIDECLNPERLEDNLWFKLGDYSFYYGKIGNCVYIFDNDLKLFFYSNRTDCLFGSDKIEYISICINHPEITDAISYINLLDSSQEYKPFSNEVNIYKQIGNTNFNLINGQKNPKFSGVKLDDKVLSQIKNIYNISDDLNLLIFKGDIRRSDTISTQVEYQFYNPNPNKINEKIDFSKLNISLRNLDDDISKIEVNLSLPIHWSKEQFEIIKDLYYDQHIFIFDSSNPFFLDVCYKFKNSNNSDVYLQDRKERYFINEAICEEGCHLVDDRNYYDVDEQTTRLVCQCPLKMILDNYTKIKFEKNETLDERFKKEYTYPNFRMMKCAGNIFYNDNIKANPLFYLTLFMLIIFILLIISMFLFKGLFEKSFKDLKDKIEEGKKEGKDLEAHPENEGNSEPIKEHVCKKDDPIANEQKVKEQDEERKRMLAYAEEEDFDKGKNNTNNHVNKEQENNIIIFEPDENGKRPHMIANQNPMNNSLKASILPFNNKPNIHNNNEDDNLVDPSKSDTNSAMISSQSRNNTSNNINNSTDKAYDINTEDEKNNNNEPLNKSSNKENNSEKSSNNNINNTSSNDDKASESIQVNKNRDEYDRDESNNVHFLTQSKLPQSLDMNYMDNILKSSQPNNSEENKNQKENDEDENNSLENIEEEEIFENENDSDNDNENKKNKKPIIKNPWTTKDDKDKGKKKKKKKKKKKPNKHNEANPPPKSKNGQEKENENDITGIPRNNDNDISNIDPRNHDDNDITDKNFNNLPATKRKMIRRDQDQNHNSKQENGGNINYEKEMNDRLMQKINRLEFEDVKNLDDSSFPKIFWSYELDNGFIPFLFKCDENDIFSRLTLILLTITLYLFVNVMIMDTNGGLNLYTQKNKEKILSKAFCLNMFIPLSTYLITYTIKRKISVHEFFVNQYYQLYRILFLYKKGKINEVQKDLGLHNIEVKISKRKNKAERRLWFLLGFGSLFLLFNFYLVSSFCGIYENSVDCVLWNTIVSIIFSYIVSRALFALSAFLRYYSLREGKKNERLFILSCVLNPYYVSYCGSKLCWKRCLIFKMCCGCKKKEEKNKNNKEENKKDNKKGKKKEKEKNLKEGMIEIPN